MARGAEQLRHGLGLDEAYEGSRRPGEVEGDQRTTSTKQEASTIRGKMLQDIVEMRQKGLFSGEDKREWENRIQETQNEASYLRERQNDLRLERERAEAIQALFDETVHDAEEKGRLKRGEHEQLDQKFLETRLAQRERILDEVKRELKDRIDKINLFDKLAKEIRDVRRKPLAEAKFWDEKEEILKGAEKMEKNLKKYADIWERALKIGKIPRERWEKKPGGYKEWFLSLSLEEQENAIKKAEEEDIKPMTEPWDIHAALPKEFQNPNFNRMGRKDRQRVLREIEAGVDRDFGKKVREGRGIFSAKEIQFFEIEYAKAQQDGKTTLTRKIGFLKMIEKQTKAEKEVWVQFEKFPDAVRDMFAKEFDEADFDTRVKLLKDKIPKTAERHNKCLQTLNNLDTHVSETVRDDFEKAKTIEDKEKLVKRAGEFQKSKNRCFKKLEANAKYFQSGIETHKHIYEQKVHSLQEALNMELELDRMIDRRKKVEDRRKKLHPLLQDRFDEDQKLSDREKQLHDLEEVDKAYKNGSVQFLIKSGETAKQRGDLNEAFAHYFQALKLDPKNKVFQQVLAGLRQQGATAEHITPVSSEDEKTIDALMARVDATPALQKEAEQLAIEQLLMNLAKKNIERTGANVESTTTQRHHHHIDRIQDKEKQQFGRDLESANDGEYMLGEDETYRKFVTLKTSGETTEDTKRQVNAMLGQKVHKGAAAESGLSEVKTVDSSGKEVGWAAANKTLKERREKFQNKRRAKQEGELAKSQPGGKIKPAAKTKKLLDERANDEKYDNVQEELEKLTA